MENGFAHNMLPGSLELAYLGDTLYDLYVRKALVLKGGKVKNLHACAVRQVCAHAQSEAFGRVEELLTDDERAVAKRARNAHQNPPKNADPAEYHRATSLEALIGYLYLTGRNERMDFIIRTALGETAAEEKANGEEES